MKLQLRAQGVHLDFYKLILYYKVLSQLSDIFSRLKYFLRYKGSKWSPQQVPNGRPKLKMRKKAISLKSISSIFKLLFTVLKNSNYFLRYDRSKSGCITGFLQEAQSKTVNILKSLKFYLLLHFLSNLAQVFRKCSLHYKKKKHYVGIFKFKKIKN